MNEQSAITPPQADEPPAPPRGPRRSARARRRLIAAIATPFILLFAAWLILYITKGRFLKHPFEAVASRMTGRAVRVAGDFQLYFFIVQTHFRADGLSVAGPEWTPQRPLFRADHIGADINTLSLIWGPRRVDWLELQGAAINLEWDAARRRNSWTFAGNGKPLELPLITRATIAGTNVRYRDPRMQIAADIAVDTLHASGTQLLDAVRFTGKGEARRRPFALSGALLSPNATITGGENRLTLNIRAAHTVADISGTLPGATVLEGAKLNVDVHGVNLADLFSVAGIAIPETRRYRLRSAVTKAGDEWRFTGLAGRFGDSDLAGRMTIRLAQPRMKVTADLHTRSLDIVDIAPFIGYDPQAIEAKGAKGVVQRVGGHPQILPDAPLRVDALSNFDATVDYRIADLRAPYVPISNIRLGLSLDDRLLKLEPLDFDMARGQLRSTITINARRQPVATDYDIRLSPTPMNVLLKGFGVEESGTTGTIKARVKMAGIGNSVHQSLAHSTGRIAIIMPAGKFWTRNVQLAELDIGVFLQKLLQGELKKPVEINCGLIGFTVRDGVAAADPILVDTSKNVIVGRGGFSFRNEALDLAVRADGKKFSLFSGQSPIAVNGYFGAPGINPISSDLFLRGGAAAALGVVATPLASVLAFVDIGDAQSAACGPVLAGAGARAQRTTKGKPRDDVGNGTTAKSENGHSTAAQRAEQRRVLDKH